MKICIAAPAKTEESDSAHLLPRHVTPPTNCVAVVTPTWSGLQMNFWTFEGLFKSLLFTAVFVGAEEL